MFKEIEQAQNIIKKLDGDLGSISFDPNDPTSISAAIVRAERLISEKISSSPKNSILNKLVMQLQQQFEQNILDKANSARLQAINMKDSSLNMVSQTLRRIKNCIFDLQNADMHSFKRHIRKLDKALNEDAISEKVQKLLDLADFDDWYRNLDKGGSFTGSAVFDLPEDPLEELGIIIKLIMRLTKDDDFELHFSSSYFYVSSKYAQNLRNFVSQVLVQFERDFRDYILENTLLEEREILPLSNTSEISDDRVFIIHGHDEGVKQSVARFIEKIGLKPIILNEQANKGKTIIEKFKTHANVGYVIALFTPDDLGRSKAEEKLKDRARQNVILELGYFIGRVGEQRICILNKGNVEIPTDLSGVVYCAYEDSSSGWQLSLAKELKSAGYNIDLNRL